MPILTIGKPRFRSRIAIFDYDQTLVIPKSGAPFPKNVKDWMWLRPNVPDVLKEYYKKGFGIYISTNQSKPWKQDQIMCALELLDIPMTVCIAYDKVKEHKPSRKMFDIALGDNLKKVNLAESFMCGDALGRPGDFSNSDLKYAEAIGVRCFSPEEMFHTKTRPVVEQQIVGVDLPLLETRGSQEIVILVGYPGSGKTHLATNTFGKSSNYLVLHGDELKTSAKMIKASLKPLASGMSVVFDATNGSKKKRAEYIELSKKLSIPLRCIYVNTSLIESMERNSAREKPVPRIVYSVYNKHFEQPEEDEGFSLELTNSNSL